MAACSLEREIEPAVIHPVRAPVNREHHGVLPGGVEVRGLDDPTLDLKVARLVRQFFDLAEGHTVEDVGIYFGQPRRVGRIPQREAVDVSGLVRARDGSDCGPIIRERRHREELFPLVSWVTPPSSETKCRPR